MIVITLNQFNHLQVPIRHNPATVHSPPGTRSPLPCNLSPASRYRIPCHNSDAQQGWQPTLLRFTYVVAQEHKSLSPPGNIYEGEKVATVGRNRPKKTNPPVMWKSVHLSRL
jgi:hypothetical protein